MRGWCATATVPLLLAACQSPEGVIQPVVSRDVHEIGARMRSAPIIVVAEIEETWQIIATRDIAKPSQEFEPVTRTIPLELVRTRAKVPLVLRGTAPSQITFYSWTWAGGKHGGLRLFRSNPGTAHLLFLKQEGPYLRTVGDYPAYDVELQRSCIPIFTKHWRQNRPSTLNDLERLTAALIETHLDTLESAEPPHYPPLYLDLVGLTGFDFIQAQLGVHCHEFPTSPGRASACGAWKWGEGPR